MKVGIITHYYNSSNYGGNLQAYALCKFLQREGYDAEQICYDKTGDVLFANKKNRNLLRILRSGIRWILYRGKNKAVRPDLQQRIQAIRQFNEQIPHSDICYHSGNISDANGVYDAFITGSDQIWHPTAVCSGYLLDFVAVNKTKVSYAASIATDTLSEQFLRRYQQSLVDFQAISVREECAKEMLQPISPVKVEWVLDPSLLIDRQTWEEICIPGSVEKPYLFCFFLGSDREMRKTAETFAAEHSLQIVTLPHLCGRFCSCDEDFGNKHLYDVSPEMLLSLIREADYVFTDSFHATVFSLIFEKEFFVFHRSGHPGMASRIRSLIALFNAENHFCDTKEKKNPFYIAQVPAIRYDKTFPVFEEMKRKSIQFIRDGLGSP